MAGGPYLRDPWRFRRSAVHGRQRLAALGSIPKGAPPQPQYLRWCPGWESTGSRSAILALTPPAAAAASGAVHGASSSLIARRRLGFDSQRGTTATAIP